MTLGRFRSPLRVPSVLVLVVLIGASVAGFFVTRSVFRDDQQRLLQSRGAEAALVVQSLFAPLTEALPELATTDVAKSGHTTEFVTEAQKYLGIAGAIGALRHTDDGFRSIVSVGNGLAPGAAPAADRAALATRALASKGEVNALLATPNGRRLTFALAAAPDVVIYEDLVLDPTQPVKLGSSGPFGDLDGAVYASSRPEPDALVITTTRQLPLEGLTSTQPVKVGQQEFLLVVKSHGNLVGSLAANAPWILLVGGLVAAGLATLLVETLARRRSYALALVDERTVALRDAEAAERQAREAAENANRAKSEFLSRMSHELRTPLNAIIGFGQLLELDELPPDQQESVGQILKGGRHLLDLINEVLDLSRIETGNLALSPEAVSVSDAITDVVVLMRPLAEERQVNLHAEVRGHDGADAYVVADRQRLKQILLNLVANAIKYNRHGGDVTVSVAAPDPAHCRIVVSDTGEGITADNLARLFRPFERLGAEATGVEGTGVGLALSRRLAEAMGGTLDVSSIEGQGSKFWVELAVTEGPLERYERLHGDEEPPAGDDAQESRHKVLYIEDNMSNLRLIERVLAQRDDIQLVPAMQGRLGLALAREHLPSVILLDLHLPDLGGEEVLQALRDDPATAGIPVIILSADATPGQVARLQAAGATAYLTKPVDVRQLLDILAEQLDATTSPA